MGPLPPRPGARPRTTARAPHRQLDQQPSDAAQLDALIAEALTWPGVQVGPSALSVPGARALVLSPEAARGPSEAFLVEREFCHGHSQGDASLHATLPVELATAAVEAGWAEPHYLVSAGGLPPTVVMLYAPRDDDERTVITRLVRASYELATGRLPAGPNNPSEPVPDLAHPGALS